MPNPFNKLLNWYFSRNALPYWVMFIFDCTLLLLAGLLTYWVDNRGYETMVHIYQLLNFMMVYVALSWIGMRLFHTYSGIMRYSSFVDLTRVFYANSVSLVLVFIFQLVVEHWLSQEYFVHLSPWSLIRIFIVTILLQWAARITVKSLYDSLISNKNALRVLIYGNMSGAVSLARSIRTEVPQRFLLRGFITDDPHDKHDQLLGEHIFDANANLLRTLEMLHIEAVLVSPMCNYEFRHNEQLQDLLINANVRIFMMPSPELAIDDKNNKSLQTIESSNLREVSVEDLLPRDEIKVDMHTIGCNLKDKRILITGSAGSIGSEMVRQIAHFKPEALMLIDQAETPEHEVRLMMARRYPDVHCETVVCSIRDEQRMEQIFRTFRPDMVLHAAAYKHVPMMEDNPTEAVLNNILGTKILADLSVKYDVKKFVMISTDKAVNPTNVMGCSKRICEIYVQSLNHKLECEGKRYPQFVTTRFGNVLGSNGSVIPLFQEQIKKGGPVTVTHPDIIRYFMLIPEACKLVLEAGTKGRGGEIFVFDMGNPVRIADLAHRMIRLSGANNIQIEYTGLRDGEKLYEEVLNDAEVTKPSFHEKIRIADVRQYDYDDVCRQIEELFAISRQYDNMATVRKMKEIVPEYRSNNSIYEQLDKRS